MKWKYGLVETKKSYILTCAILFYIHIPCKSFPSFDKSDFKTESILLHNVNSDSNVFEKNANMMRPPASLTKIMTFIVVNDCMKNDRQQVKVDKELINSLSGTYSSLAKLDVNHEYTIYELLLCMMVRSGNDAALVLAHHFGNGNVNNFVKKMNEKASELNCTNTHFMNPHGLHDVNHYSSCEDILKIIKCAMKIDSFVNIVKTPDVIVNGTKYKNTNKLLDFNNKEYYYKYNKGIKTGYHNEAGFCFSSLCEKNGIQFIGVFMGAPTKDETGHDLQVNYAMKETKSLCESAFDNLILRKITKKIPSTNFIKCDPSGVLIVPYKSVYEIEYMSPRNVNKSDITVEVNVNQASLDNFPICKGDSLGTICIKYNNDVLKKVNIKSKKYVGLSFKYVLSSMMKHLFIV